MELTKDRIWDMRFEEFKALYAKNRKTLMRICIHYADYDADLSGDLMQELYYRLWQRYPKVRVEASVGEKEVWLRLNARQICYRYMRWLRKGGPLDSTEDITLSAEEPDEKAEMLSELLSYLSEEDQAIIHLLTAGYRHKEIGEMMGLTTDSVSQRIHRAKIKMREAAIKLGYKVREN